MEAFIHGPTGAVHTIFASAALLLGAFVLFKPKGTKQHRIYGYLYVVSMLLLNITAIPITNMTGSIGFFHVFIVISLPTILMAMYYPLFARTTKNWMIKHFSYMYWSYVGLIAAFIAEVMVRLPLLMGQSSPSFEQPGSATASIFTATVIMLFVMAVAEYLFRKYRRQLFH
ncbi:DUF2306 domain-containing protein [Salinimonas chungwhensis]|uniref:DUF2306 domain-containing protein n=1 Tax=Salinimonas chungwhensis TaxID=265425 RepID=UPI00037565F2|nr:DUF2306 domain-containing protein [Salinimonas chungwhensis]